MARGAMMMRGSAIRLWNVCISGYLVGSTGEIYLVVGSGEEEVRRGGADRASDEWY